MVSWADRIAYVCHDFEDAVKSGIVTPSALPPLVRERCGDRRSQQLGTFIDAVVSSILTTGRIGMVDEQAEALAAFRASNYEHIYLRPSSVAQGRSVVSVLRALVDYFGDRPNLIPDGGDPAADLTGGEPAAVRAAVAYVAGMTDRFAFSQAVALLGWDPESCRRAWASPSGSDASRAGSAEAGPKAGPGIIRWIGDTGSPGPTGLDR